MRYVAITAFLVTLLAGAPGEDCRRLTASGKPSEARPCFDKLTRTASQWARAEGFWGLGQHSDANDAFKLAVGAQPKNAELRTRWGRLFLERFQLRIAGDLFKEALQIQPEYAPALLGTALVASEGFDQLAVEYAKKALTADPKLVEAQELLAKLALEDSNPGLAREEADKALKMSAEATGAMAVLASIDVLADTPTSPWFEKIKAVNPRSGQGYETAAHFLVLNRRYEEGIAMYRKALEVDPDLQSARSQLGINLMRLGNDKEAFEQLETAYKAKYDSDATVNSLRLIDSYRKFDTFTTPTTVVKLQKKESELLRPYIEGELKRAIATFEKKYQLKLGKPVQVEVYPDHEDFAVRTMGMPGLGALGVTFGHVVAMDSPSGRPPGTFHWASTLWHELSHVYVLTATNHRVPRWFTEGMAVHEETAASPEWGDRLDPVVIRAMRDKKLLPVAQLDRGFIRPAYPAQVVVSYFQAGRICDFINEKWGYGKLLAMMRAFAKATPTPEVIKAELEMTSEEFDKQFLAWLDGKYGKTVAGFAEWQKRIKALMEASQKKQHEVVLKDAPDLIALYPEYVDRDSTYELLARSQQETGNKAAAAATLERYAAAGGKSPAALTELAKLQSEAGNKAEAARTYERIMWVYPMNEELHRDLGELYLQAGNAEGAIREYSAALSLKPLDQAGARYNLARALMSAKKTEEAKDQLLQALETAPGYKPAQRMLLDLSR